MSPARLAALKKRQAVASARLATTMKICAMRQSGYQVKQIAKAIHRDPKTVKRWVSRLGLATR